MNGSALRIAVVGAESTGKTTLAAALPAALAAATGLPDLPGAAHRLRVAWVPEALRGWCERAGRTPLEHEQASILRLQQDHIEAAAATHDVVVCDTTPLMTAVYSRIVFGDRSLDARAAALHARCALTLLTALDLPWVPDGLQREGPHVQGPVDAALRELLLAHRLPFEVVAGSGPARLERAVAAVLPVLRAHLAPAGTGPGAGLFTRLTGAAPAPSRRTWACSCCAPDAERPLARPPSVQ
jgi:nicotinamide riboside kinase